MTDGELARLQELADAATAGPWTAAATVDEYGQRLHTVDVLPLTTFGEIELNDAAFIAASREAVPALIAEVRRLRAEVAENDELRPIVKSAITELVRQLHAENERLRDLLRELVAYGIRYRHCGEECVTDMVRMARSGIPREVVND